MDTTFSGYDSESAYLEDVFSLITLRLQHEVLIQRRLRGDTRHERFLGLFLSDQEVDAIFHELREGRSASESAGGQSLDQQIDAILRRIAGRVQATAEPLPPQRLAAQFGLGNNEIDLLLYLLAPEVDGRFGRVYGYLHDDVGRKRLSPGLAYRLMRDSIASMTAFRHMFAEASPLLIYRLIRVADSQEAQLRTPLLERPLRLEDRVVNVLLGDDRMEPGLFGYAALREPDRNAVDALSPAYHVQAERLAQLLSESGSVLLECPVASDADLWVHAVASSLEKCLLELDWGVLAKLERGQRLNLVAMAQREALMQSALLYLHRMDEVAPEDLVELKRFLLGPVCLASARTGSWHDAGFDVPIVKIPETTVPERSKLWHRALGVLQPGKHGMNGDPSPLSRRLAERYPLASREMTAVVAGVKARSLLDESTVNLEEHIVETCKRMAGRAMNGVAQKIETFFRFPDLVLPPETLVLLKEVLLQQRHGALVLGEWALGRLFHQVRGCRALFVGPSGTGKTMAASVLANELGLELYRIDLSQVVSKYIGETEKNLDRVFNAASRTQVVLFIDEADALFGKRSEVKDAHDRYANIEISFLLQKMEEYEGTTFLATNLSQNMDDAFFRRIDIVIEFPMPQEADRLRLWHRLTRSAAPLSEEVDLAYLAKSFELSGGHIKNCILSAAFYAAEEGGCITMAHLVKAVGREYLKIGKPISRSDFGEYYPGIRKRVMVN